MAGTVDVLFVDEAGQKSLADVVAVSGAARNIVLLGDPQQLAQPSQGQPSRGRRGLRARAPARRARDHAGRARPVPRHHVPHAPDVCRFISEVVVRGHGCTPSPVSSASVVDGRSRARRRGSALRAGRARGQPTSSTEEAVAVASWSMSSSASSGPTRRRQRELGARRRARRRAVQRAGGRAAAAACPTARASAPSTSSRARKRRSRSTRWPRRAPTTSRAAWSSSTTCTASTSPCRGPGRCRSSCAARAAPAALPQPGADAPGQCAVSLRGVRGAYEECAT